MLRPLKLTALALGLLACTAGVAELAIRIARPPPRVQLVRLDHPDLHVDVVDGVPLWSQVHGAALLRDDGCPTDDSFDVVLAGDSILHTVDGGPEHNVAVRLRQLLADDHPPVCVLNVSSPAYLPVQQLTEARRAHDRHGADLVFFGVWKDPGSLTRLGDAWATLDALQTEADGLPPSPLPAVPRTLHAAALHHSHLWRYASLALAPAADGPADAVGYGDLARWAHDAGVPAVFVEFPSLDRPFEAWLRERAEAGPDDRLGRRARWEAEARAQGADWRMAAEALRAHPVEEVRLDRCCHYATAGHEVLARALADVIRSRLSEPTP